MSDTLRIVCGLSIVGVGFAGGLVFTFSNFVMRALAELEPHAGAKAMQRINRKVYNPVFMGGLFGTTALAAGTAVLALMEPTSSSLLALGGAILFLVGVFGVTAARNVPLNKKLDIVPPCAPGTEALWAEYQSSWNFWNRIRTVSSFLSCIAYAAALASH